MEHVLILLAISLILNNFHKCDAELNLITRDTEVMVNDSTYMNCSTSLEPERVLWLHGNNYVYTGRDILEPYNVRFSVEINSFTGTNNLVIRSVQPSDAGKYECLEDDGFGERRSAQLIVLNDHPVCKSNLHSCGVIGPNDCGIEPDEIKLSCSMKYHGNTFPVLQWKASGVNTSIIEGLSNFTSSKNEVTYTLTMKSTLDLSDSSFICQTMRTSNRNYSCSSDVIKILYVFSSNVTSKMTMNDEVSCFANTSQSCSYKWKWFSGDDSITVSNDQTLKPNRVGWHRCEATCSLGSKLCAVEPMYAEVYSSPATSEKKLHALLVLFALPVIVLIGVVIFLWRKIQELEREVERKREQELQRLIGKNEADPTSVQTIRTKAATEEKKEIKGFTILDEELFVVSEKSSEVEVYDSMKFSFSRRWNLKQLSDPYDIVSCNRNKCLYIFDYKGHQKSNEILRIDPKENLIKKWSTGDDYGFGLSVTDESNVILTVYEKNKLNEYSSNGQLIREINLSSSADIRHPWHAIKLTSGYFVVSHGCYISPRRYFMSSDYDDELHRVCIVDGDGKLKKSFGGKFRSTIGQMKLPVYLAVDENGFVMVSDFDNSKVFLLDSDLEFNREILSKEKHKLRYPRRIFLDQINRRLFVAVNERDDNRILIFKSS